MPVPPAGCVTAILRGIEISLLGRVDAGEPGGPWHAARGRDRTKPVPCPTCPGGRAGPGGAYAFAAPAGLAVGPAALQARSCASAVSPRVRRASPVGNDPLRAAGRRAALARITWPGKPGRAVGGAADRRGTAALRPGPRGLPQRLPGLPSAGRPRAGSDRALAGRLRADAGPAPTSPRGSLLQGKEGPIGLMPPVGSTLDDEQIAAVLTYVRREWGQSGSPVAAAAVADARRATAGRNRPWRHDELMAMVGK